MNKLLVKRSMSAALNPWLKASVCCGLAALGYLMPQQVVAVEDTKAVTLNEEAVNSIKELQKRLDPLQSMTAQFTQITTSANARQAPRILEGEMRVARPGRFRWQTQPPFEQLTVTDGVQLWIYDADLEQVTIKTLDKKASQTPALILTGSVKEIEKEYKVYGTETSDHRWQFALLPKQADALFSRLQLVFDAKDRLHSMTIDDGLGQKTEIRFSNVQMNVDISSDQFKFKVPKGVEVIRDPAL